ncbi:hypothetical protein CBOM_02154 [Ceraceosorus bombacis]|uniref:Cytochrome c oxidase assembly factor 3 n=1 Tax=Ceraceosorus bombacis TaxID=401625 RepID=A0A0P1BF46_9BASI|nr:hypothetical protein CBOM_02154 [Ceraceosorus bombacis]
MSQSGEAFERGGRITSGYSAPRSTHETYHPGGYGVSEGLRRARRPYAVKNALTGSAIMAFAVGAYYYSIRQVKPDDTSSASSSSLASNTTSSSGSTSLFGGGDDNTPSPAAMPIGPLGSLKALQVSNQKGLEDLRAGPPITDAQRDELRAQILIAQGRLNSSNLR